jgi:hypothetical protein
LEATLPGWDNVLEAIDPVYWLNFSRFVGQMGFYHGEPKPENVISVREYNFPILDRKFHEWFLLTIFCPSDSRQSIIPQVIDGVVQLAFGPGEKYASPNSGA